MLLEGRVALVTGAGQGIGMAIALSFLNEGAKLVLCDNNNLDEIEKKVDDIKPKKADALALYADVSNSHQVQSMIETTLKHFGRIDILVNNAGVNRDSLIEKMSEESWESVIQVNLTGTFFCTKYTVPHMLNQEYGRIINISSTSWLGNIGQANYAASKGGMVSFTRTAALELARKNITVNCVAPGLIDTPMMRNVREDLLQKFIKTSPSRRMGTPEEIAHSVLFLASRNAGYITGQVLHVCGGISLNKII